MTPFESLLVMSAAAGVPEPDARERGHLTRSGGCVCGLPVGMHYEGGVFRGCDHACIVQRQAEALLRESRGEQTGETPMPPAEREAFIRSLATQLVLDEVIHGSYEPEHARPTRGRSYLAAVLPFTSRDTVTVTKSRAVGPTELLSVPGASGIAAIRRGTR